MTPCVQTVDLLQNYLDELGLKLVKCLETHVHADHITGASELREGAQCETFSSVDAKIECAPNKFPDQSIISLGELGILRL